MKTDETVIFKRDGLFGKGIVLNMDTRREEYDRFVSITEIFETSKHCAAVIGDIWGIDEGDLSTDQSIMWRKPFEVSVDGSYIMTRMDDDQENQFLVYITNGRLFGEPEPPIRDFDPECRFFGPIPDCKE